MKYRNVFVIVAVCAGLFATASCKDKGKGPAPSAAMGQLPAGVAPGSYGDWCELHHVPLSQDTKCNPDLIPVFKAAGDWCEEDDVPESQCTKCHPDIKIVRPPPPNKS